MQMFVYPVIMNMICQLAHLSGILTVSLVAAVYRCQGPGFLKQRQVKHKCQGGQDKGNTTRASLTVAVTVTAVKWSCLALLSP
jgi:hypothetical protein